MTKTVYLTASTLNGFLADESDSLAWLFSVDSPDEALADVAAFQDGVGSIVMGSATYRWLVENEGLEAEPQKWQSYYGDRPVFVFTSQDQPVVTGAAITFVNGDVASAWPAIAAAAGDRDVWIMGGGGLAAQFAEAGLLDELRISYAPAALSAGKPLFPLDLMPSYVELTNVRQFGQFAELTYALKPHSA